MDIAVGIDEIGTERTLETGFRHDERVDGLADAKLGLNQGVLGVVEVRERAAAHIVATMSASAKIIN